MNQTSPTVRPIHWTAADAPPRVWLIAEGHPALSPELLTAIETTLSRHCDTVGRALHGESIHVSPLPHFGVVLGGDGTILRAVSRFGAEQIPILAVNIGKLGFLASVSPEQFPQVLSAVANGNGVIVEHLMLHCQVERGGEILIDQLGLNETAVLAGPPFSILEVDLFIQGEWITTYNCDGLLISTPVGSTAHSLSAGGPILQKGIGAFVICPISPHTMTVRPLVDSAEFTYELRVRKPNSATSVVVDGRMVHRVQAGDRILVRQAQPRFQLIEVPGHSYYRTLREKLGWAGQLPMK